jgi:hypothetical protein
MFLRRHTAFPGELAWYRLSRGQGIWPYDPNETFGGIFGMVPPEEDPNPLMLWIAKLAQQSLGYDKACTILRRLIASPLGSWYSGVESIGRFTSLTVSGWIKWLKRHNILILEGFHWKSDTVRDRWPYLTDSQIVLLVDEANKIGPEADLQIILDRSSVISIEDRKLCMASDIIQKLINHGHDIPKSLSIVTRLALEIDLVGNLRDSVTILVDLLIDIDLLLVGIEHQHLNGIRLPNRILILIAGFDDESLDSLFDEHPTVTELIELGGRADNTALSLLISDVTTVMAGRS